MAQYSLLCYGPAFLFILVSREFSDKGNIALETILRSCRKMSNLEAVKKWSMLVSILLDTAISTSFRMELWPVIDVRIRFSDLL